MAWSLPRERFRRGRRALRKAEGQTGAFVPLRPSLSLDGKQSGPSGESALGSRRLSREADRSPTAVDLRRVAPSVPEEIAPVRRSLSGEAGGTERRPPAKKPWRSGPGQCARRAKGVEGHTAEESRNKAQRHEALLEGPDLRRRRRAKRIPAPQRH